MAAPEGNTNNLKWTLETAQELKKDIFKAIESGEIQYMKDVSLFLGLKHTGAHYVLKKLKIKQEVGEKLNSITPNRPSKLPKIISDTSKIKNNQTLKKRYHSNPKLRLRMCFHSQISYHLGKGGNTDKLSVMLKKLGYSIYDLKKRLEETFKPEMNWDNYGEYWHLDHIKPVSWFSFNNYNDDEFIKCFSLNNLQALEASKNISKGNRYEG